MRAHSASSGAGVTMTKTNEQRAALLQDLLERLVKANARSGQAGRPCPVAAMVVERIEAELSRAA